VTSSHGAPRPERHRYGADPSQFADLYPPGRKRWPGIVVLIHGGWWGPTYGADNLAGTAADLAARGWATWNIEYRRLGLGGGYPSTLQDAAAAIDYLATLGGADLSRVVAIGHSAGGQLATWAAGRPKLAPGAPGAAGTHGAAGALGARPLVEVGGVISLAGVLDLVAGARQGIGKGAVPALLGGDPEQVPERYAVADPLTQVPVRAAVRCVHARHDDRVPFAQSAAYVTAAQAAGQDGRLVEVDGDHFSVADPAAPSWPAVIAALEDLTGAG
jgi:acetyl esterase/lipase